MDSLSTRRFWRGTRQALRDKISLFRLRPSKSDISLNRVQSTTSSESLQRIRTAHDKQSLLLTPCTPPEARRKSENFDQRKPPNLVFLDSPIVPITISDTTLDQSAQANVEYITVPPLHVHWKSSSAPTLSPPQGAQLEDDGDRSEPESKSESSSFMAHSPTFPRIDLKADPAAFDTPPTDIHPEETLKNGNPDTEGVLETIQACHMIDTIGSPGANPGPPIPETGMPLAEVGPLIAPLDPSQANSTSELKIVWASLIGQLKALHESIYTERTYLHPLRLAIEPVTGVDDSHTPDLHREFGRTLVVLSESMLESIQRQKYRFSLTFGGIRYWARALGSYYEQIGEAISSDEELNMDEAMETYYRNVMTALEHIRHEVDLRLCSASTTDELLMESVLSRLLPEANVAYDSAPFATSRHVCTPNTRVSIRAALSDWSTNSIATPFYWINGMAGTGKTTLAYTLSDELNQRGQLGASFFCSPQLPECCGAKQIIPFIAYQLARYSCQFRLAVYEAISTSGYTDLITWDIQTQVQKLLIDPLGRVKGVVPDNPVVVIDGLDQCENKHDAKEILCALLSSAKDLPLKFLVTSRPHPVIYDVMITQPSTNISVLHLHDVNKSQVQQDIRVYLEEELALLSPTPAQIDLLGSHSGTLFMYASVIVRFISYRYPMVKDADHTISRSRLETETSIPRPQLRNRLRALDSMYTGVLRSALGGAPRKTGKPEPMRLVLKSVLSMEDPIDIRMISALTGITDMTVLHSSLSALRDVLYFSYSSKEISIFHESFREFMLDRWSSRDYFCDVSDAPLLSARDCFQEMKEGLRFNMCNLDAYFVADKDVPGLSKKVVEEISPFLSYACRHWGNRLHHATDLEDTLVMLSDFLSNRLLFWMEVLNFMGKLAPLGVESIQQAIIWIQQYHPAAASLLRLACDARRFIVGFATSPACISTTYIYISMPVFCPIFSSGVPNLRNGNYERDGVIAKTDNKEQTNAALQTTWNVSSPVHSVAFSPEGTRIAFGCEDGTTGVQSICNSIPLITRRNHVQTVKSVAFWPDGRLIASGSDDQTVQFWGVVDAGIQKTVGKHKGGVTSIAYSHNGKLIASSSRDCTVRLWSTNMGIRKRVAGPFIHTHWVSSVVFSPDDTRIATGSGDFGVRIWNTEDGSLVFNPIYGHTDIVNCLAYSPDGLYIVSGSSDRTILKWNTANGEVIGDPFRGHDHEIKSIAFSPNGSHLISSSTDQTIRLWDLNTPQKHAILYQQHSGCVTSVAFSPNGAHIASGSEDGTIQLPLIYRGVSLVTSPESHTHWVQSVAISPDGTQLVSGSRDRTVCVWNLQDGELVAGPFVGHTSGVTSVTFSHEGSRVVSGSLDRTIRLWSLTDNSSTEVLLVHTHSITSIALSPDGKYLGSTSTDGTIRIQSIESGAIISSMPKLHNETVVHTLAFSPDSLLVVTGSWDGTACVWRTEDGTLVAGPLYGHTDSILSVSFSPTGTYIATASLDLTIRFWDAFSGAPMGDPIVGHVGGVSSISFSPDGSQLVSGSFDRTIRVWDTTRRTPVARPLYGHTGLVTSVLFSPDGKRIISGSNDRTIRLWKPSPHNPAAVDIPPTKTDTALSSLTPIGEAITNYTKAGDIVVREDGWVMSQGRMLFWVPYKVSGFPTRFSTRDCELIIGRSGAVDLDLSHIVTDADWQGYPFNE